MDGPRWIASFLEKGICEDTVALGIELYDESEGLELAPDMLAFACLSVAAKFEEVSIASLASAVPAERRREALRAELAVLDRVSFSLMPLSRRHAVALIGEICLEHDVAFRLARRIAACALSTPVRKCFSAATIAWSSLQIARANATKFDDPCIKAILLSAKSPFASSNS